MKELALFVVGIVVGIMNAIAGGGMLIGFPALLVAGMSPLAANITSNLIILPGQVTSAFGYRKYIGKLSPRYLILLLPCIVGSTVGALVLRHTSSNRFQQIVPGLILFAILLFTFQPFLHLYLRRRIRTGSIRIRPLLIISLALLPTAVYGGYFGPGFGFIMLAFLSFTRLHDMHKINGLKNLANIAIASVCILCLYSTHQINWPLGLSMAAGNAFGGYSGARLSLRFSSHAIRIAVIIIGFGAAAYLALRTY